MEGVKFLDSFKMRDYQPMDLPPTGSSYAEILRRWRRSLERNELIYSMNMSAIDRRRKVMNWLIVVLVVVQFYPVLVYLWRLI